MPVGAVMVHSSTSTQTKGRRGGEVEELNTGGEVEMWNTGGGWRRGGTQVEVRWIGPPPPW